MPKLGTLARFVGSVDIRRCGHKQKHWTQSAAVSHLNSLLYRFGPNANLNVYRCRHCGARHVGRRAKQR